MHFSPTERLVLGNQFRILAHIDPTNAELHSRNALIVERGYEREYRYLAEHISPSPMGEATCDEVHDVLSMHEAIQDAHKRLGTSSPVQDKDVKFYGFSGKDEPDQYGYLDFIIESNPAAFQSVDRSKNASAPGAMLPQYRRMLEAWRKVYEVGRGLSADELRSIVDARRE